MYNLTIYLYFYFSLKMKHHFIFGYIDSYVSFRIKLRGKLNDAKSVSTHQILEDLLLKNILNVNIYWYVMAMHVYQIKEFLIKL